MSISKSSGLSGSTRPRPGTLIHFDTGVQFASWAFTDRAKASGLVPSMGSVGDCYDNSMIESFWSHAGRTP
jgi:putative transposase